MALNNAQYEEIMRDYYARQIADKNDLDRRTAQVYLAIPEYKHYQDEIADITIEATKARLRGDSTLSLTLAERIDSIVKRMDDALTSIGLAPDYLQMHYTCPLCQDTGYIGQEKCSCFKQAEINLLYHQSNVSELLGRENFDAFSYDYYSDSSNIPDFDLTPRENMRRIVGECKEFIENFHNGENLLFMGNPGVGKTFLTNCIAKELLDRSHSVLYTSAIDLFNYLSYKNDDEDAPSLSHILECELLIIDDLGTEVPNTYTNSKLFQCINNRLIAKHSTIISTNFSLKELMMTYSERLFSRVYSSYKTYRLVGDDIRLLKK